MAEERPTNHDTFTRGASTISTAENSGQQSQPVDFASAAGYSKLLRAWSIAHQTLSDRKDLPTNWSGRLSTSALSTATAISALEMTRRRLARTDSQAAQTIDSDSTLNQRISEAIAGGLQWLGEHQNTDGGFGDTDRSHSNIATTLLCLAAHRLGSADVNASELDDRRGWDYVREQGSWDGLRRRYGKDKTFVVPILSNCALAELVPWEDVPPLPFEAAYLPQRWYRLARMPVVSYAIPALVAIGQARFHFAPPRNPLLRSLRRAARKRTLGVLARMQPESGGYLEAVPLTSFVLMNLAAMQQESLPVAENCLRFLLDSRLEDGSWPIDTNLATWVTNLSVHAFSRRTDQVTLLPNKDEAATEADHDQSGRNEAPIPPPIDRETVRWILDCQHTKPHPFTGATPGGWGWTNLSGAVPDADDTPAAILALSKIDLSAQSDRSLAEESLAAVARGVSWLLKLQNRDGGWPTFCRGWGQLPFDRSGTDLTAHCIRAIHTWLPRHRELSQRIPSLPSEAKLRSAMSRGFNYLQFQQQENGSWLPLWFGNQDRPDEDNPVYGTGKVLLAYAETDQLDSPIAQRGIDFLRSRQNADGGWGGGSSVSYFIDSGGHIAKDLFPAAAAKEPQNDPSSPENATASTIEETSLALEALLACGGRRLPDAPIMRGLDWLCQAVGQGHLACAWPIGFYFAKLWYYEDLYPTIFATSALGLALQRLDETCTDRPG